MVVCYFQGKCTKLSFLSFLPFFLSYYQKLTVLFGFEHFRFLFDTEKESLAACQPDLVGDSLTYLVDTDNQCSVGWITKQYDNRALWTKRNSTLFQWLAKSFGYYWRSAKLVILCDCIEKLCKNEGGLWWRRIWNPGLGCGIHTEE